MQLATILEKNATVFLANDNPASLVEHAIESSNHSPSCCAAVSNVTTAKRNITQRDQ